MPSSSDPADNFRISHGDPAKREEGSTRVEAREQIENLVNRFDEPSWYAIPATRLDQALESADLEVFLDVDAENVTQNPSDWRANSG